MVYVFYEKLPLYDLSSHTHKFIKSSDNIIDGDTYNTKDRKKPITREPPNKYDPPLPVSVVNEQEELDEKYKNKGGLYSKVSRNGLLKAEPHYDPPLPVSVVNEKYTYKQDKEKDLYGTDIRKEVRQGKDVGKSPIYDPPLPTTMLEIKSTRGKHSTEKPVALMEWLLKYYSKEGDIVLDPTMGGGSTGVACKYE